MLTREIKIGSLLLGGNNPVRIQSMTNTDTMDTNATVSQILDLWKAGCEMVRITTRNKSEALNLINIKKKLHENHCYIPLVADIHFQPEVAEVAARIAEKIRINPGNFLDKTLYLRNLRTKYTESKYNQELENISLRLKPLLNICNEYGTAIRIGVNHGSLSERINWKFGNTIEGMVASALEYIEICRNFNFHNLVISIKSSDVKTMINAYRLLCQRMMHLGYDYPLHLGVTEAGAGIDARLKSAAGIGVLLSENIGDTIRVSLTENPVNEIYVAKKIIEHCCLNKKTDKSSLNCSPVFARKSKAVDIIGGSNKMVCASVSNNFDYLKSPIPDYFYQQEKNILVNTNTGKEIPCLTLTTLEQNIHVKSNPDIVYVFDITNIEKSEEAKQQIIKFRTYNFENPVLVYKTYHDEDFEEISLKAACDFSGVLIDDLIDGICIHTPSDEKNSVELMFNLLQATGLRHTRAEFIACPTCGRTSYNVENILQLVKEKFSHLKQLKIAVMGCVVNGPGEMADADYGFVGTSGGKVNLYRRKQAVMKNIPENQAIEEMIKIIKNDGLWTEP